MTQDVAKALSGSHRANLRRSLTLKASRLRLDLSGFNEWLREGNYENAASCLIDAMASSIELRDQVFEKFHGLQPPSVGPGEAETRLLACRGLVRKALDARAGGFRPDFDLLTELTEELGIGL